MRREVTTILLLIATGCTGTLFPTGEEDDAGPTVGSGTLVFRPTIQGDLDDLGCTAQASCHGGTSTTPMHLTPSPSADADWTENFAEVSARAGTSTSSLLLEKAMGAGGHVAPIQEGDVVELRWRAWIAAGTPFEPSTGGGPDADIPPIGTPDAGPSSYPTWDGEVFALIQASGCLSCHGSSGSYSLQTYDAAFGNGSDQIPNVIPGNPLSLLVQYAEQGHRGITAASAEVIHRWVVDGQAREN